MWCLRLSKVLRGIKRHVHLRAKIAKKNFLTKFFADFMKILIQKMQQMLNSRIFERKMLFQSNLSAYLCSS